MDQTQIKDTPEVYGALEAKCAEIGFTMPSDVFIGTLLKSLIASKPNSNILELGTGIGLSLAWMIEGLDAQSRLTSVDNDPQLTNIAKEFFGHDQRVNLVCMDGADWILNYQGPSFDLIFADAWPGKYGELDETLALLKVGGLYVIDDMTPASDWPEGHAEKATRLIAYLEGRDDLTITKMEWSTGVIICTRTA
ncbi:MAG: class I SAM-dependent methyltransferase [Bacteroidota bacterium]